jgi:hypothetical protein
VLAAPTPSRDETRVDPFAIRRAGQTRSSCGGCQNVAKLVVPGRRLGSFSSRRRTRYDDSGPFQDLRQRFLEQLSLWEKVTTQDCECPGQRLFSRRAWDSNPQALAGNGFQARDLASHTILGRPSRSPPAGEPGSSYRVIPRPSSSSPRRNGTRMAISPMRALMQRLLHICCLSATLSGWITYGPSKL